jgi:hypothetical protein
MKKMQEKSKIYNIHAKAPTPPQTKENYKLPLKPSHMDGKHQSPLPRKAANREESRGLVKMSVNCLSVSIYLISMSPFST